jgi:hypothetical protein
VELTVTNNYLPEGVWLDPLVNSNMWDISQAAPVTLNTDGSITLDPIDTSASTAMMKIGSWPAPSGTKPALFTYRAQEDMWIKKVRVSICQHTNDTRTADAVGIADSTGYRVTSVDYTASAFTYVDTAASYSGITPTYTIGAVPAAGGSWRWYTMEVDLPYSAVSAIDGHREVFDRISVGFWNSIGWTPIIGAVELTVGPRPPEGSLVILK